MQYMPHVVELRIKLGKLSSTPSLRKKLDDYLCKMTHPWHLYRYLNRKSLGRFYDIVTAYEYFRAGVPNFEIIDD